MNFQSHIRLLVFLSVLGLLPFAFSGCSGCKGNEVLNETYDFALTIEDKTVAISTICYPQAQEKCLGASGYFDYDNSGIRTTFHTGGAFLRGENETNVVLNLSNGQKETLHFTYNRAVEVDGCENLWVEFSNLKLLSTTIDSFYLSTGHRNMNIVIVKF